MEQAIIGYRNGEPVFEELFTQEEILEQLYASQEWADFKARFDMSLDGNNTLGNWVIEEKLGPNPKLADYKNLFKAIIAAGGVVRVKGEQYEFETVPVVEPVVEPEVPRDRNGNPLSASQIAWGEMTRWSQTASSKQIADRRRVDPAFESFYKTNLRREAQGTESTQFRLAGQQPSKPDVSGVSPELVAFADEFRRTSMDEVRLRKSPTLNPLGWEKYQKDLDAALAAGLIGR
jgi:hypothetical protein